MIQQFSVHQIKANVRIEDVVRSRGVMLHANPSGERLKGQCPFHPGDETPSLNIYISTQRYHCFGCGADGDVIDFVQASAGCSWREAIERLSTTTLPGPTTTLARLRTTRLVQPSPFPLAMETNNRDQRALLTTVQRRYQQQLLIHPSLGTLLYKERGITGDGIRCCGLGYADGSLAQALCDPAQQQHAQTIGLLSTTKRERMWQRLIIPECTDDDCSWMIGRTLYHQMGSRQSPKYLGLSLSKPLLGYGLALKLLRQQHLVRAILVVEGAIDYVIASQWHLPIVCVALVGTHASKQQLSMLLDLQQRANDVPLVISLDADEAGRQASQHLLGQLRQGTSNVTELAPLAEADIKDIGDLGTHPQGYAMLHAALEQTLTQQGGSL